MSKTKSVAEILASKKKATETTKEEKKKPAIKKAVVISAKKTKSPTQINHNKKPLTKKEQKGIENLRNPDKYLDFVRFIATPDNFKEIKTQKEFAKEHGVNVWTLSEWKKRDGFWDLVAEERKLMMKENMTSKIIMAVYRTVLREGNAKEAKLLLELSGDYQEKKTVENTIKTLTPERAKEIDERFKMWDNPDDYIEDDDEEDEDE